MRPNARSGEDFCACVPRGHFRTAGTDYLRPFVFSEFARRKVVPSAYSRRSPQNLYWSGFPPAVLQRCEFLQPRK